MRPNQTLRLLLADDHALMREGLRALFETRPELNVVGEVDTGQKAVDLAGELLPDVVIMDVGMQDLNGIEATRRIVSRNPGVKVIGLSMYADRRYVLKMLEAGASGYVLKAAAYEELWRALSAVSNGQMYLSSEITGIVVKGLPGRRSSGLDAAASTLGSREREVLQMIAEGRKSVEIARRLSISPRIVDAHRRNIAKKLDLHTTADLTKYAIREGLTSVDS